MTVVTVIESQRSRKMKMSKDAGFQTFWKQYFAFLNFCSSIQVQQRQSSGSGNYEGGKNPRRYFGQKGLPK